MTRRKDAQNQTIIETAFPGPLYPDRCLECNELIRETYGCVGRLRCADCAAADRADHFPRVPIARTGTDG